jgi:hypothetical protein
MKKEKILIYLSKILGFIIGSAGFMVINSHNTEQLLVNVPFSIPIYCCIGCVLDLL